MVSKRNYISVISRIHPQHALSVQIIERNQKITSTVNAVVNIIIAGYLIVTSLHNCPKYLSSSEAKPSPLFLGGFFHFFLLFLIIMVILPTRLLRWVYLRRNSFFLTIARR